METKYNTAQRAAEAGGGRRGNAVLTVPASGGGGAGQRWREKQAEVEVDFTFHVT